MGDIACWRVEIESKKKYGAGEGQVRRCPWAGEKYWAPLPTAEWPGAQCAMSMTAGTVGTGGTGGG